MCQQWGIYTEKMTGMCNSGVHVELGWYICRESRSSSWQALRNEGNGWVSKSLCRNRYIEENEVSQRRWWKCWEIMRSRRALVKVARSWHIMVQMKVDDLHVSRHLEREPMLTDRRRISGWACVETNMSSACRLIRKSCLSAKSRASHEWWDTDRACWGTSRIRPCWLE